MGRSGPPPLLIVVLVGVFIIGGYFIWIGLLQFLEDQGNITAQVTRQVLSTGTAESRPTQTRLFVPATFTPLPPCQEFMVIVDWAITRDCPSEDNQQCPRRDRLPYGTHVCVYARARDNDQFYVVDLNPEGAFREIVFMHQSVIRALHPTPVPSATFTPLPTITPLPTETPLPTIPIVPTETPDLSISPTPSPTWTPSRTPPQIMA